MAPIKSFDPDLPDETAEYEYGDSWEDTSWSEPKSNFERKLLASCGRKKYHTKAESNRTQALERMSKAKVPKYPPEYIEGLRAWAEKENKYGIKITFDVLLKTIRNVDRLTKYKQKLAKQQLTTSDDEANMRIMNERKRTSDTQ